MLAENAIIFIASGFQLLTPTMLKSTLGMVRRIANSSILSWFVYQGEKDCRLGEGFYQEAREMV